jgi:hypothetical protein
VPRPRLIEWLNAGANRKLTPPKCIGLISAPTGFDKTVPMSALKRFLFGLKPKFVKPNSRRRTRLRPLPAWDGLWGGWRIGPGYGISPARSVFVSTAAIPLEVA